MITGRCQSTRGVGAEPHSRSHQGRHPQPCSPPVPQKGVSAQRTPTRGQPKDTQPGPAPGAIRKQPTLSNSFSSCSRGHGEREGQQISCHPSFFWVVFFYPLLLSFLCPLFPRFRAGKLLPCAREGQMSRQISSALLCSENSEVGELMRTGTRALRTVWEEEAAARGEHGKGTGWDAWHLGLDCTLHLGWRGTEGQQSLGKP